MEKDKDLVSDVEAAIHISIGDQKLVLTFEQLLDLKNKLDSVLNFGKRTDTDYDELLKHYQWTNTPTTTSTGGHRIATTGTQLLGIPIGGSPSVDADNWYNTDVIISSTADSFAELKDNIKVGT
jgi:hypothetical protein